MSAGRAERARVATEELLAELELSPYFRGAAGLGYVLRSQLRGFLDDLRHPLPRRLLRYLHELGEIGGNEGRAHLLAREGHARLQPGLPALDKALRQIFERHRERLEAATREGLDLEQLHARFDDQSM